MSLWVDELVSWWACELMSLWVDEFVGWWVCKLMSLWVDEFVGWWVCGLIPSGVVCFLWGYKPVVWFVLHFVGEKNVCLVLVPQR